MGDDQANQLALFRVFRSAVHDMKDSLGLVLGNAREMQARCKEMDQPSPDELWEVLYAAQRINGMLERLSTMQRILTNNYTFSIDIHGVRSTLYEVVLANDYIISGLGIGLDIECDESLTWFFDQHLVSELISSVIISTCRYVRHIHLIAEAHDGWLEIRVEGDGAKYPAAFEHLLQSVKSEDLSQAKGTAWLNLFFAHTVAQLHANGDRQAEITLGESASLGGSAFVLRLP